MGKRYPWYVLMELSSPRDAAQGQRGAEIDRDGIDLLADQTQPRP